MNTDTHAFHVYASSREAWNAMFDAIEQATQSIYWELYIFVDDEVGTRFFDILSQKAAAGVDVKLLIDSFGSFSVSKRRIDQLLAAGVDVHFFQERKAPYRGFFRRLVSRTHRKILVIDEHIGFIGGVNVDRQTRDWLDLHVRIEGDAVRSLLRSFAKMYMICGGNKHAIKHLLQYPFRLQKTMQSVEFIYDDPHDTRSRARKKYTEALYKARERVILFSPYYFPDKQFLRALWQARKRGIRVDLLIPFRTDIRIASYAAYAWFSVMKRLGVNVHLSKEMMHGKGVIVDDDWVMIGSSNLEHGSFYHQYEANVHLKDRHVVGKIKGIVSRWIDKSVKLEDIPWEKRSRWQKIKEWIAVRLYKWWFVSSALPEENISKQQKTNNKK